LKMDQRQAPVAAEKQRRAMRLRTSPVAGVRAILMRATFGRAISARPISNDLAKPSMKWLFIFAAAAGLGFFACGKKETAQPSSDDSHAPHGFITRPPGSDDLRFRCRFLKALHSFRARRQNNRLFKLRTHFPR
jgi:hypothetical protein